MSSKILVADDSLTIQKVISITLANTGFNLEESHKEEDLLRKIEKSEYDLILLDFNLSENKSGYELAKIIHERRPQSAILVMLGTFDTVDENKFSQLGIFDKIIKPFESAKFVKKCREAIEARESETVDLPLKGHGEEKSGPATLEHETDSAISSWTLDAPKAQKIIGLHSDLDFDSDSDTNDDSIDTYERNEQKAPLDPLNSEIKGWGFSPQVNLEEKFQKVFPPVIELKTEDYIMPLKLDETSFEEVTDSNFQMPEDLNRDLLSTIDEEVEADSFWAVDEVVPVESEENDLIKNTHLEDITADYTDTVKTFLNNEKNEAGLDELVNKLKMTLLPEIEKMVREYCQQTAEKVSWEVIPDLAENLIKKEIKEISSSI